MSLNNIPALFENDDSVCRPDRGLCLRQDRRDGSDSNRAVSRLVAKLTIRCWRLVGHDGQRPHDQFTGAGADARCGRLLWFLIGTSFLIPKLASRARAGTVPLHVYLLKHRFIGYPIVGALSDCSMSHLRPFLICSAGVTGAQTITGGFHFHCLPA